MPIPSSINDLSITAGSNSPAGHESPGLIDDYLRTYASYIALLRDQNSTTPQTIASAALTDIGAAASNVIYVTGTTTITSLGVAAAGVMRTVRFLAQLTLTHNGTSLVLPGLLNIITGPNDTAEFQSLGSGQWLCLRYTLANTKPAPIVGTVSQSGGATNGAVMEYVTNGTGEVWKFASGLMITSQNIVYGALTWSVGTGVRFLNVTASLPVSFIATPKLYAQCVEQDISTRSAWVTTITAPAFNSLSAWLAATSGTTGSGAFVINVFGVGRWY